MSAYTDEIVDLISQGINSGKSMDATLDQLRRMMHIPDDVLDDARFEFEQLIGVIREIKDPAALISAETRQATWYIGPKPGDVFWPAVAERLANTLDGDAIEGIHKSSSKILSVMSPPGATEFDTRGLVLGYVQSGKTTSFISVIAKAADAGYRVFIVLSGVTDNLRSQTQSRVDDLLIGPSGNGWYKLTSLDSDFAHGTDNAANLLRARDFRFIAVVKKNPARLRRLRDWLRAAGGVVLAGVPVMIVDDEADQASIDVAASASRASTINRVLREILRQPKAAYVAYTATPFANLLIDPGDNHSSTTMAKDLYPADFIVPLAKPNGYFGAERMFGRAERLTDDDVLDDGMDVIRNIPVEEAGLIRPPKGRGAVNHWVPSMTGALADSIRWFVLSTAARRLRGIGNRHSTMLVHTSMLAEAHSRLCQLIYEELDRIRDALAIAGSSEISKFRDLYEREIGKVPESEFGHTQHSFDELEPSLIEVVIETRVIMDNYRSADRLVYDDEHPATTIVVGGNTLSRGLTLEGLSSSYFVRSASAYDTLLQMGRWFGYRHGYEDLCRVWMTDELREWFRDLSLVEAEIRNEMLRYEFEGLSPREAAVRIRTHPDMAITAAAKMRSAVTAQMSYSEMRPQTILFSHKDKAWLTNNIDAVRDFVSTTRVGKSEQQFGPNRRGFVGVDVSDVLRLIRQYNFHPRSRSVTADYLEKYIKNENAVDTLLKWNVVVLENPAATPSDLDLGLSTPIRLLERSRMTHGEPGVANLKAIVSTYERVADFKADRGEIDDRIKPTGSGATDAQLLALREQSMSDQGLLCIYPIDKNSKPQRARDGSRSNLEAEAHLVGLAFFFPRARGRHSQIEYMAADLSGFMNEDVADELEQLDAADAEDNALLEVS